MHFPPNLLVMKPSYNLLLGLLTPSHICIHQHNGVITSGSGASPWVADGLSVFLECVSSVQLPPPPLPTLPQTHVHTSPGIARLLVASLSFCLWTTEAKTHDHEQIIVIIIVIIIIVPAMCYCAERFEHPWTGLRLRLYASTVINNRQVLCKQHEPPRMHWWQVGSRKLCVCVSLRVRELITWRRQKLALATFFLLTSKKKGKKVKNNGKKKQKTFHSSDVQPLNGQMGGFDVSF